MANPRPNRRERVRDDQVRGRADELHQAGMPFQMAMAVAHGRLDLNEALQRMALKDRVTKLMERHDLSRALATQVAMGHADLDRVLARRRLQAHREEHRDRTCLVPGQAITIALTDGRHATGTVGEVGSYEFGFVVRGKAGDESEQVHKLQARYAYAPDDWKKVRKVVRADKSKVDVPLTPAERPQDRYSCSDKRMFTYLDEQTEVQVTLLGGETIRGTISWFGRYEFGVSSKGTDLTVFRHAMTDLRPAA